MKTLLLVLAIAAAVPPDLADLAQQIEHFPREGNDSARLKQFFDLYWTTKMHLRPDLAVYVGYSGLEGRLVDSSPEMTEFGYRLPHLELAALASINRAKLTPPEQLGYDLARRKFELSI